MKRCSPPTAAGRNDDIHDAIIKHARDYDLWLTCKQVRISRSGINGNRSLSIDAESGVPGQPARLVDVALDFHPSNKDKGVS